MFFRKKSWEQQNADSIANFGLDISELSDLSDYNSRRGHGVVHTKEYDRNMAKLQKKYNEHFQDSNRYQVI